MTLISAKSTVPTEKRILQEISNELVNARQKTQIVDGSGNVIGSTSNALNVNTSGTELTAIQAALEIMDDWDETNRAAVNLVAGQVAVAGGTGSDAANVLRMSLATDIALPAGGFHLGQVGGDSDKISNTIVTTNGSAYTAEDNIGGINTITNALRTSGGTEVLIDVLIWDKDDQKAALQIDYWDASPSGTYTNDAGQVIAGDSAKWLGTVEIAAGDYKTTGAVAKASIKNIGLVLKGDASRDIFFTIKTTETPTYTSTSGLIVSHGLLQD